MAANERNQWVIPSGHGVKDYNGNPRATTVRLVNGQVLLCATTAENEDLVDARTCIRLPNDLAEELGYHLQCAAEANRLRHNGV